MEIELKTLTPLWTGGVDGVTDRLHETGLIGSLRWWYEALVRGLDGYACDPTSAGCPDENGKHCVVCELFGCTGWGRKFRLQVISTPVIEKKVIKEGQTIQIQLIPLREINPEEWSLLQATMRFMSEYGAIGGKTIFKPSKEPQRQKAFHHQDFGLVRITPTSEDRPEIQNLATAKAYITDKKWRSGNHSYRDKKGYHDYSWASLQNFWCVKGHYLARENAQNSPYNQVLGRKQPKQQGQYLQNNSGSLQISGEN